MSGGFEQVAAIETNAWVDLPGWNILYGAEATETMLARAAISNSLQRLPGMLAGLL